MTVTTYSGRLLASEASRRIVGMLLPHGEVGLTSLGPLRVPVEASLTWDADIPINREHDRSDVVGRLVSRTDTPAGTMVSLDAAETPEGDAALAAVRAGELAGLSVEMDATVTPGSDGVLTVTAGRVYGAALVARPAYASAQIAAAWQAGQVIEHDGERFRVAQVKLDDDSVEVLMAREEDPVAASTADSEPAQAKTDDEDKDELPVQAARKEPHMRIRSATAPAGVPGQSTGRAAMSYADYIENLRKAHLTQNVSVTAALKDITQGATTFTTPPQWLGELWGFVDYERVWVDAFTHRDLTGPKFVGWRWKKRPTVGAYPGHPKEVPSDTIEGEEVSDTAVRFAGAHDIDRAIFDFGNTEFIDAYNREMAKSYAEQTDAWVARKVLAAATQTETSPKGDYPAAIAGVVRGFFDVYRRTRMAPTFAFVAFDLWEAMFATATFDAPAILKYLAGLTGGKIDGTFDIRPAPYMADGTVFVGHKSAAPVGELPGSPIRAEAPHIAAAGIDTGVYGYIGQLIEAPEFLSLVTVGGGEPTPTE